LTLLTTTVYTSTFVLARRWSRNEIRHLCHVRHLSDLHTDVSPAAEPISSESRRGPFNPPISLASDRKSRHEINQNCPPPTHDLRQNTGIPSRLVKSRRFRWETIQPLHHQPLKRLPDRAAWFSHTSTTLDQTEQT